ncbi:HypC/HybG/HupF family hydrogenase formation chaperone [Dictyobacter aurantiacus]|uniref:Hydrogenase assembly protein HupF n=1 Tax=Dictyobacter aurantiacus TaxID=1936993 RepID=A0A401ZNJ1_9CHLR|nr:HypC/HybG/HupF family hydrogenase formation chaperone [Dictyobacter aurantiacus]GCE08421.1 hypothetical protein KDAU_57500 [Dictyobacter aurantiacus]
MSEHDHAHRVSVRPEESCVLDEERHCLTCSDEAIKVRVVAVKPEAGTATVAVDLLNIEEVDISLLERVRPGDLLLVHAGVALERCSAEEEREEAHHA